MLDNIEYQGGDASDPTRFRVRGGYEARIGKRQLAWLEQELRRVPEDKLVFLAMHAPLVTSTGPPDDPRANTQDRRKLLSLLEGREHLYAVAGHTHTTEHHYLGEDDGFPGPGELHHHVLATASGSWWSGPLDERGIPVATQRDGTPNGYHLLEVDGTELTVRYKAAGLPAEHQMRVMIDSAQHLARPEATRDHRPGELLDADLSVDQVPAARVLVNLFDGGPRSRVELSVGDGPPSVMTRTRIQDPSTVELFLRHADTKKPWVEAVPSTHLWVAPMPDLSPGVHALTVRASDEFGRVHHAHRLLEVTGSTAP